MVNFHVNNASMPHYSASGTMSLENVVPNVAMDGSCKSTSTLGVDQSYKKQSIPANHDIHGPHADLTWQK